MKECVRVALCDSKEPMPSIQDFYETDDLQVWTYFERDEEDFIWVLVIT